MPHTPQWQRRIDEAQLDTHFQVGATRYPRRPYGCEVPNPRPECRDCGVAIGQLHVSPCTIELCAVCGDLAQSCDCAIAGEAEVQ